MAQTILCLEKGRDRGQFMRAARAAGVHLKPIKGLKRHFVVDGVSPADFPLRDHPAIEAVDDGEAEVGPAAVQSFTLDFTLTDGPWAIARTIRRKAPWPVDGMEHPFSTYFRSNRDGTGVDLYWLDTGTRPTHDEFGGRWTNVYESYDTGGAGDEHGHGTATSSWAAGESVGLARGSLVWSFGIATSSSGGANTTSVATAIGEILTHYAARSGTNRPAVANMAFTPIFGGTANSAFSDMIDAGIVVCVAADNAGVELDSGTYPTAFVQDIIVSGGVGPTDIPFLIATGSGVRGLTNYGERVDVVGPALYCRAAGIAGDTVYIRSTGGTSAATAYTAGVVACMLQGYQRLTTRAEVQAVRDKLIANATTGALQSAFGLGPLPDAILYLDPDVVAPEPITGLTELAAPNTPTITVAAIRENDADLTLADNFTAGQGGTHHRTQYRAYLTSGTPESDTVYDSGPTTDLLSHTTTATLPAATELSFQARWQETPSLQWSEWSTAATDTTSEASSSGFPKLKLTPLGLAPLDLSPLRIAPLCTEDE